MTTINQARESIYQAFVTGWANRTVYVFDNEQFRPPADKAWVRLSVRHTAAGQTSLGSPGNRRFRRAGVVFVQVFVPVGDDGLQDADEHVRAAQLVFEGATVDGIWFLDVVPREIGPDGKWYQFNVEASFEYEEIR